MHNAIHYINQFYAGFGGEAFADKGLFALEEVKGPAIGLSKYLKGEITVSKVIGCGDNFANREENFAEICQYVEKTLVENNAEIFIAGPAFNAGRYGVACAKLCDYVREKLHIPSVTAMWKENPAVKMFSKNNYILQSSETSSGMNKTLEKIAEFALKIVNNEKIGSARSEGYFPTGHRYNEYNIKTGAERVVDMLLDKLNDKEYYSEVPLRETKTVSAAPAIKSLSGATIALFTTGGLVPIGNPDKIKQAFATNFGTYDIEGYEKIDKTNYESIHGGYDTSFVNEDPNRLVPLDVLNECVREGKIKAIYKYFGSTCGVGTNINSSEKMGREWAQKMLENNISAVILTST